MLQAIVIHVIVLLSFSVVVALTTCCIVGFTLLDHEELDVCLVSLCSARVYVVKCVNHIE